MIEGDPQLGEIAARDYARDNGLKFISPYNDFEIIEGQGTCGLEILNQWNASLKGSLNSVKYTHRHAMRENQS